MRDKNRQVTIGALKYIRLNYCCTLKKKKRKKKKIVEFTPIVIIGK